MTSIDRESIVGCLDLLSEYFPKHFVSANVRIYSKLESKYSPNNFFIRCDTDTGIG